MAEYQFTESEAKYDSHIRDMLNALSIQFEEYDSIFVCSGIDEKANLSTFNIRLIKQTVYFTRTDHEFQAYHSQLMKISKYLEDMNITFVIPKTQISTYVYTKEDNMNELSFINLENYDTFDGAYKCQLAFTMLHYMIDLATQSPDKPYFTDKCPYFTHITEWAYNRDDLEVNQYLHINYTTQMVLSLNFIYNVAHIPYVNQEWIRQLIPFIIYKMKSDDQHIQRTALKVAAYLYREKKMLIFKEVGVRLVSGDVAAKMYVNELR
jgi:hypothetical protein